MRIVLLLSHVLIAVDYTLIGILLWRRVLGVSPRRFPRAFAATLAGGLFFFGCVHTHLLTLSLILAGDAPAHWYSAHHVVSHVLQALGGAVFWWLVRKHLVLNIYDKALWRLPQGETAEQQEQRLDRLAMRVGLIR